MGKRKTVKNNMQREYFALSFSHPVGSAPGCDPDARLYKILGNSYSFIEIGPFSPSVQGDDTKRPLLRRLFSHDNSVTNKGVKYAIQELNNHPSKAVIAANIIPDRGHNTPESISKDMLTAFTKMYDFTDIFVIDTFLKNADGITILQDKEMLEDIIDPLLDMRCCYDSNKPILFRIKDDIPHSDLSEILDYVMYSGIEGVIAGYDRYCPELVKTIGEITSHRLPIIACGGIDTPEKAKEMLDLGACLVQTDRRVKPILKFLESQNQ